MWCHQLIICQHVSKSSSYKAVTINLSRPFDLERDENNSVEKKRILVLSVILISLLNFRNFEMFLKGNQKKIQDLIESIYFYYRDINNQVTASSHTSKVFPPLGFWNREREWRRWWRGRPRWRRKGVRRREAPSIGFRCRWFVLRRRGRNQWWRGNEIRRGTVIFSRRIWRHCSTHILDGKHALRFGSCFFFPI